VFFFVFPLPKNGKMFYLMGGSFKETIWDFPEGFFDVRGKIEGRGKV